MESAARLTIAVAGLFLANLGAASASPANPPAEERMVAAEPSDERFLLRQMRRQGFRDVERVERQGRLIVLQAVRPTGAVMRLTLDATSGQMVASERIGWLGSGEVHRRPPTLARRATGLANL
ncbi:hypothetical protein [Aurantimonas sp. Leaf443]|uniref:hypothetical protein n=1 Tax=Aurantimonas sp. Leaf443 TaxID=1736378 RepID=UPI000A5AB908|nr:hypothetical protein [Aurantimonas sp. Leaf443]